jgi:hypothetical protein
VKDRGERTEEKGKRRKDRGERTEEKGQRKKYPGKAHGAR